jgi:hypothetical protein
MRDLLFVAHAVAFASLATGLRAWLHRPAPVPSRVAQPPRDDERYRSIIRELAGLERRKDSGDLLAEEYATRRKALVDEATRLRRG